MRIRFLDNLPPDKVLHCLLGAVAFLVIYQPLNLFNIDHAKFIAFGVVLAGGVLLEYLQRWMKTGHFERLDYWAVGIGAGFGFGCSL